MARYKTASRRDTTLGKRDREAFNARDHISLRNIADGMHVVAERMAQDVNGAEAEINEALARELLGMYHDLAEIDALPAQPRARCVPKTIADFHARVGQADFEFSQYFRFQSADQLRRLITGFQMPEIVRVGKRRYVIVYFSFH